MILASRAYHILHLNLLSITRSSLLQFGALVEDKFTADIDNGVLEVIPQDELTDPSIAFCFHPVGAVPKGESDCRLIVDSSATGLNACIKDTDMHATSAYSVDC